MAYVTGLTQDERAFGSKKSAVFTATANQTVFNLNFDIVPGTNVVQVFINGVKQAAGAYVESARKITLTEGVQAGDLVEIIADVVDYINTSDSNIKTADVVIGFDTTGYSDGDVIYFKGREYVGDGGGGVFHYAESSTQPADGGIVFSPTGSGRLLRDGWTVSGFNGEIDPRWFGAKCDGSSDDTVALSNVLSSRGKIDFSQGTTIVGDLQLYGESIEGIGVLSVIKAKNSASQVLKLGNSGNPSLWSGKNISKVRIDGNGRTSDGVSFEQPVNPELSGRWTLDGVTISNSKIGINKKYGNIGNRYRDLSITSCDIGYKAVGQASPIMHAGNDIFYAGEANSCDLAAFIVDSTIGSTGGTVWRDFIVEGNPGFGIFIRNWYDSYTPLTLDNVWFEQNATSSNVTIDSVTYSPRDLRIDNASMVVIKNGMLPKTMKIVNSNVSISDCSVNDGPNVLWEIDSNSTVIAERMSIDGGASLLTVNSLVKSRRASGTSAQIHYAPPRIPMSGVQPAKLQSLPYDGAGPFLFTGSTSVNGTSVADGVIFDTCCELVVPNGATLVQPAVTMTSGKWYVLTLDAKLQSGTSSGLTIQCTSGVTLAANIGNIISTSWKTIASVSKSGTTGSVGMYINNATGGSVTLRLSAWQIMEFNTEQEALNYYNQRSYYK